MAIRHNIGAAVILLFNITLHMLSLCKYHRTSTFSSLQKPSLSDSDSDSDSDDKDEKGYAEVTDQPGSWTHLTSRHKLQRLDEVDASFSIRHES